MSPHQQRDSNLPIELAAPARRALDAAGYYRLEQHAEVSKTDVKQLHGIGPKVLDRLRRALACHGLAFADERLSHSRSIP